MVSKREEMAKAAAQVWCGGDMPLTEQDMDYGQRTVDAILDCLAEPSEEMLSAAFDLGWPDDDALPAPSVVLQAMIKAARDG